MMRTDFIDAIVSAQSHGIRIGITSVCSAHPLVIGAALSHARNRGYPILVEATCNQVNQFGGYTGMRPVDFAAMVEQLAAEQGLQRDHLILGGDHLGPLPWAKLAAAEAMHNAEDLVRAYVSAGFTKLHLDCSMPLGGEKAVSVEVVAQRTARLAKVAEEAAGERKALLRYVVGSEVPPAGGAKSAHVVEVTTPESVSLTLSSMHQAFLELGLTEAWSRVIALVVQPGVEFGDEFVREYNRETAHALAQSLKEHPGIVYEAHSTDYQSPHSLRALVEDGFAILKVGPWLTFALREAAFALAAIEKELFPDSHSRLREAFESAMDTNPEHWRGYYHGDARSMRVARLYSQSDRIRYYWSQPQVRTAFEQMLQNLESLSIPYGLLSQYMPLEAALVRKGKLANHPHDLLVAHVHRVLDLYHYATTGQLGE